MSRTPDERLAEILADFRAAEPAAPAWIAEESVKRVINAWTRQPVKLAAPLTIGGVPMHAHNRWKFAWKFRSLDMAALAADTGLTAADAAAAVDRLAGARLIYPDGTLSQAAASAVQSQ